MSENAVPLPRRRSRRVPEPTTDLRPRGIRVRAIRPIVYDARGAEECYIVPQGMTGSLHGASKPHVDHPARLRVYWDDVTVWTYEVGGPQGQSYLMTWWEDGDVDPATVEVIP